MKTLLPNDRCYTQFVSYVTAALALEPSWGPDLAFFKRVVLLNGRIPSCFLLCCTTQNEIAVGVKKKREAALYACRGDDVEERLQGGRATLTTHRILWSGRSRAAQGGGMHVCMHLCGKDI